METLTEAEPIDDDRGEEAEEPAVCETKEDAGFPEVVDVVDGVAGQLGDDEHGGARKSATSAPLATNSSILHLSRPVARLAWYWLL